MTPELHYLSFLPILLMLAAVLSILIGTLRTGISPMPSSGKAHRQVIRFLEQNPQANTGLQLLDCGSGWGHLAFKLARRFPKDQIVGYELSLLPWLFSRIAVRVLGLSNLQLVRANFLQQDLSAADTLISYLHPQGMRKLQRQLTCTPSNHSQQLISIYFALPDHKPVAQQQLYDLHRTWIYRYRLG